MKYSKVHLESMGYELAPVVVTSRDLEERLAPTYEKLKISPGQIESLTGIYERRWWEPGFPLSKGATAAAKKALAVSNVKPDDIGVLIYGSVGREHLEPATACSIGAALGMGSDAIIYDLSNACLGVMNGIIEIANQIELGNVRAGMAVSCESARNINEIAIRHLNENPRMDEFIRSATTFTGGSGASALLLTDDSFSGRRRLVGGAACSLPKHHKLCRWGLNPIWDRRYKEMMQTDALSVLRHGIEMGDMTWKKFKKTVGWTSDTVDKSICHQVAKKNQEEMLRRMGISPEKDFVTYPFLGNIGSVSLPITAAIAEERGFLCPGDKVIFAGIGSGLNSIIMGWEW
jgi:3-oxoacyl-[acyl-carrier-protein] synthase III